MPFRNMFVFLFSSIDIKNVNLIAKVSIVARSGHIVQITSEQNIIIWLCTHSYSTMYIFDIFFLSRDCFCCESLWMTFSPSSPCLVQFSVRRSFCHIWSMFFFCDFVPFINGNPQSTWSNNFTLTRQDSCTYSPFWPAKAGSDQFSRQTNRKKVAAFWRYSPLSTTQYKRNIKNFNCQGYNSSIFFCISPLNNGMEWHSISESKWLSHYLFSFMGIFEGSVTASLNESMN